MPTEIRAVTLRTRLYAVNCYLVKGDAGYVLIDTGLSTRRAHGDPFRMEQLRTGTA